MAVLDLHPLDHPEADDILLALAVDNATKGVYDLLLGHLGHSRILPAFTTPSLFVVVSRTICLN
jgi:hypothetical protein